MPDWIRIAGELYERAGAVPRLKQQARAAICPFDPLIEAVPQGARVLDVGCGAGLFLACLAREGRIAAGRGFDASAAAVAHARAMLAKLPPAPPLAIEHRAVEAPWPDEQYDLVSMVDVLHHIDPAHQREAVLNAAARVRPGGLMLYKDMAMTPRWMAAANRLHDLVFAQQWINYAPFGEVAGWLVAAGFRQERFQAFRRLWYAHELGLFRKPGP